ncbi:hypothetical protein [Stutzerimonas chloritidismutans]
MNPYPLITKLARKLKRSIFIIDCESTGFLDPDVAIVELGYLGVSPSGVVKREATLVNPGCPIYSCKRNRRTPDHGPDGFRGP